MGQGHRQQYRIRRDPNHDDHVCARRPRQALPDTDQHPHQAADASAHDASAHDASAYDDPSGHDSGHDYQPASDPTGDRCPVGLLATVGAALALGGCVILFMLRRRRFEE